MAKPKRPHRTARRAEERAARELVRSREKLAAIERGGAPDRPIEIPSSSVIEPRVTSLACPQCRGSYRIEDHRAETVEGISLRVLDVRCVRCGVARPLWFRIGSPLAN